MNHRLAMGFALAVAFAAVTGGGRSIAEDKPVKSGLQVGESPGAFNPLHCNGKNVGQKNCLV